MTIKWTESATVKLVLLYGRYECLRNPFHRDFNEQLCCYKAYKQIVQSMKIPGLTVCDCVKRISFIKKQYCFELSKISAAISRGVFYKPKPSWFEMMHELLFPYVQSDSDGSSYINEDSNYRIKDCDCEQSVDDEEGNGDRCENDANEETADDCPCPPCECPPPSDIVEADAEAIFVQDYPPKKQHRRSKSRTSSKSRGSSKSPTSSARGNCLEICNYPAQGELLKRTIKPAKHTKVTPRTDHGTNTRNTTSERGNEAGEWTIINKKRCVDASNRTSVPYIAQTGAQTERKTTADMHTGCERSEKAPNTMNDVTLSAEDVCVDSVESDRSGRKYKHHDEFDMFGKSIACQLRSLNLESAINLEKRIQDMMTEERLCSMKDTPVATVKTFNKECCTCDHNDVCKECFDNSEKNIKQCACGLPVSKCLPLFPRRTSQCYGFACN